MTEQTIIPNKIRIVYGLMLFLAMLLITFCLRWQVVEAGRFRQAAATRERNPVIHSLRGTIYAADGTTLAYSERTYDVFVYMPELDFAEEKGLQTRREFCTKLAPHLDTSSEALCEKVESQHSEGSEWIQVAKSIPVTKRNEILALRRDKDVALEAEKQGGLQGYFFQATSKRLYPEGRLASHIIGLTNMNEYQELAGFGGIEGAWDGYLEPIAGFIQGETDALGNANSLATDKTIEAKRGNSIYLTLDKNLQQISEARAKWATSEFQALSASIVIMDPKTGEILALANYPDYDPNLREEKEVEAYSNQAITDAYEIGSVGKVFSLAAAIDSGSVTPDTVVIQGHNGCEWIHEDLDEVCTHDHLPQPPLPISEAFALSDNIYFLRMAELMEREHPGAFYDYLKKFGIGNYSGVDMQGEWTGFLKDWQQWNIADVAAYSYGHSYQANVVQIASGLSAIANNGVRAQPHIVHKVVDNEGEVTEFKPQAVAEVVKPETTAQIDAMMNNIYQNNIFWWEWYYDDLRAYPIGMKSGTALIPNKNGTGYSNEINATYIGYDQSPDRKFVMVTRIEEPQVGDLAGQNSRILWLETFREIKDYLGMTPQ